MIAGDAADASGALALVEQAEDNTQLKVEETTGDCAYGGGPTRQAFSEAGRELLAKVPKEVSHKGMYTKSDFVIDLENAQVTCPAGETATRFQLQKDGSRTFVFGSRCNDCALKALCTGSRTGRSIRVHPQESMLKAARAYKKLPMAKRICAAVWQSSTV